MKDLDGPTSINEDSLSFKEMDKSETNSEGSISSVKGSILDKPSDIEDHEIKDHNECLPINEEVLPFMETYKLNTNKEETSGHISSGKGCPLHRPTHKPKVDNKESDESISSAKVCLEKGSSHKPDSNQEAHSGYLFTNGGGDVHGERPSEKAIMDSEEDRSHDGVPTDQGWSWLVCFSVFMITLLQFGHDQAIFVLFVDFVEEFQQPTSVMTSMFTIFSLTAAFSSLFTSNVLMSMFSSRQITCSVAILGSTLTFLLSRCPNVLCVLVVFGFKGLCFGALQVCPTSLLGFYFKRRIALATAISNTGLCAAFILFPALTQMLREEYGLRGTLLILSALELHIAVVGMFLRPVETYRKLYRIKLKRMFEATETKDETHQESASPRPNYHDDVMLMPRERDEDVSGEMETLFTHNSKQGNSSTELYDTPRPNPSINNRARHKDYSDSSMDNSALLEINPDACAETRKEHYLPDSGNKTARVRREEVRIGFLTNQKSLVIKSRKVTLLGMPKTWIGCCKENRREQKDDDPECLKNLEDVSESQIATRKDSDVQIVSSKKKFSWNLKAIFDTSLLKIWPFRMILLANGLGTFTSYVNIYMPTAAVQAGLTKGQAASLLTVVGALDLCSRVVLGYLADTRLVAKTKIVSICLACIAVLCHMYRFYSTYAQFLIYAACVGLTCGCRHNLLNVILIDHLGVVKLAKGLGLCSLLNTALLASNHLTIGFLLDASGSFVVPMHFVGSVVLAGSFLYFAEPFFVRLEKARKAKEAES